MPAFEDSHQNPGSYRDDEFQQGFDEEPTSISGLMQSSAVLLENECIALERELEAKTKWVDDMNEKCAIQAENIAKQQLELQHIKVKTENLRMVKQSALAKIDHLRGEAETLKQHFNDWSDSINMALPCLDTLSQIHEQLKERNQKEAQKCILLEQNYKEIISKAKQGRNNLQARQVEEQSGFDKMKGQLRSQLECQEQIKPDLKKKQRKVKGNCKELVTVTNMLTPRNKELTKTMERLRKKVAMKKEEAKSTIDQVHDLIQKEKNTKEELITKIEDDEKKIYIANNTVLEKEAEIKVLDSNQKQLFAEEEDFAKLLKTAMEENSKLLTIEQSMKERYLVLMGINEENSSLKLECKKLEDVSSNYKNKIADVEEVEGSYQQELEKLNKTIEEKEKERIKVIDERLAIEEKIKNLQKEINDDVDEHQKLSIEIDKPYAYLKTENDTLIESLDSLSEQLYEASQDKEAFEEQMRTLKIELARAKAISQEKDNELYSFAKLCKRVQRSMKIEKENLIDMKARTIQDYTQAVRDEQITKETKQDIEELKIELERTHVMYDESLEKQQELHNKQIEAKNRELADIRVRYEREFQDRAQSKMDALMELKENQARIVDLQKQKTMADSEVRSTKNNLVKCDNLLLRLENKLNVVAQVASNLSQSIADPSSQFTNQLATPRMQASVVASPGSDSSGLTFNPDEVMMKVMRRKPSSVSSKTMKKPNIPKKSTKVVPQTKKDVNNEDSDWGF